MTRAQQLAGERDPVRKAALVLGPGFITGAADDDPSGIGTYSVAGASLGLATLWTALLTFPFMAAVQNICSRLGQVSGSGLAGILKEHYPRWVLYPAVALVFVANVVNIGADLGAIADAAGIVVGTPVPWLVIPVAFGLLAVQVLAGYRQIERVFKLLTLALLAYVIDVVLVHPPVGETLRATFVPTISFDHTYIATLVAILGTTISPYLFFWQTSQEVEEERAAGRKTRAQRRGASRLELRIATIDVNVGMLASNLIMYFIILATALTLNANGKTDIPCRSGARRCVGVCGL
ncbi:MAG: divalent metal cation transporter [Chloroflexi bacterium]|nr:MAG: divalent metal cation transporter [Chloroflexota bacterium]